MRFVLRLTHVPGRLPPETYIDKGEILYIVPISNVEIVHLAGRILNSANYERITLRLKNFRI